MKLITRLEKSASFWFLLIASVVFFFLRWPSLFEPYWYGDEGIYQSVGMLINSGASLYSEAWDNKPPLLYVLYALFNSEQFVVRTVSLFFGLISLWVFYLTAKRLFANSTISVLVSTSIFAILFGTRLIEGNIANAENFMMLPILASAYLILSTDFLKKLWEGRIYFLAGILLSLAFLTKIVAIFDFLAFASFLFISREKDFKQQILKKVFPFTLGFLAPISLTFLYFFLTNNFKDFFSALLFSNVGYVGYGNKFFIPQGLLYLKAFILAAFVGFLFLKRNSINKSVLFVVLWFAFSLFNAFFAGRSYAHYLLVLLPSFCLMIGVSISARKERFFLIILLALSIVAILNTFKLKAKFIPYYSNLISFCTNKKDVSSYQSFFDRNTPRDYELARYIRANTSSNESIFIWGNNAQVYKLSNKIPIMRYIVAYHITNYPTGFTEMQNAINSKRPKLIIVMPNVPPFPLSLNEYNEKINIRNATIYERIF
ncbi:MAG: glycosyltransferase family 39 protein [Candidatus Levybacteria bacterium]|nr:glycosyltransferase family 39 protein [Candidatus Levybacteria bacterium]